MKYLIATIVLTLSLCSCISKQQQRIERADAYYNRGLSYSEGKQSGKAFLYYDSALMYYVRPEYYTMRGAARASLADYDEAIIDLTRALVLDSVSEKAPIALRALMTTYIRKGDNINALYNAKKLNRLKPNSISSDDIGIMYYLLGDYANALSNFSDAFKSNTVSQPTELLYIMGDCWMKLGDEKHAKEFWEESSKRGYEEATLKLDSLKQIVKK